METPGLSCLESNSKSYQDRLSFGSARNESKIGGLVDRIGVLSKFLAITIFFDKDVDIGQDLGKSSNKSGVKFHIL